MKPQQQETVTEFELLPEQGLYYPASMKQEPQKIPTNCEFTQVETDVDESLLIMQKQ